MVKPEPLLDENVVAVRFFNLLSRYTNNAKYQAEAHNAMRYLLTPEVLAKRKIFVGGFLLADRELNSEPVHITTVGSKQDTHAFALFQQSLKYPSNYKQVEWYDKAEGQLPGARVEYPSLERAAAFACASSRCSRPIFDPATIQHTVDMFWQHSKEAATRLRKKSMAVTRRSL